MEKIWFVYSNNVVSGPFATDELKHGLLIGQWNAEAQVWWRGQREWLSIDTWYEKLSLILDSIKTPIQSAVWFTEKDGVQDGPLTKDQLIEKLKSESNVQGVRLWTVGKNQWENIFAFNEITFSLGLNKRRFDRAPIVGHVTFMHNGRPVQKRLSMVSGGGVCLKNAENLNLNEGLTVTIHSRQLPGTVRANTVVKYVDGSGAAGLEFQNIHVEAKTKLMDYVRNYSIDPTGPAGAAGAQ